MAFLKGFLRNLVSLAGLGLIIYLIEPGMVKSVFEAYWMILGPIGILLIIVAAIPQKRRKRSK
jgi:hypothetical protein